MTENDERKSQKQTNLAFSDEKQTQKQTNLAISEFPTMIVKNVYETINMKRREKYSWLADNLELVNVLFKELSMI